MTKSVTWTWSSCVSLLIPQNHLRISQKSGRQRSPDVPVILVGNNKDIRNDPSDPRINAFAYLACSAKSKEGVREVFETAARAAMQNQVKIVQLLLFYVIWGIFSSLCILSLQFVRFTAVERTENCKALPYQWIKQVGFNIKLVFVATSWEFSLVVYIFYKITMI